MRNRFFVILIAILSVLFCITNFYISKSMPMLICSIVFCILIIFILIHVIRMERTINNTINHISEAVDALYRQDYSFLRAQNFVSETIESKILQSLYQIAGAFELEKNRNEEDQKALKSLISDVSHQTKTTITNIRMLQDAINSGSISAASQADFSSKLDLQLDKLAFIMDAMVKSSRLEFGLIKPQIEENDLFETLRDAVSHITKTAGEKNIELQVDCPDPYVLKHDSKWIAEAIGNLLDNAVKYSEVNTKICCKVIRMESYTRIDVEDQGCGITEEVQGKIFQRFYREEKNHYVPGVGIGLFIVRDIIKQHEGYIKLSSAADQGSTFSLFLPN